MHLYSMIYFKIFVTAVNCSIYWMPFVMRDWCACLLHDPDNRSFQPRQSGQLRVNALANFACALEYLRAQQLDVGDIDAEDLSDGQHNSIYAVLWLLVQLQWRVHARTANLPYDTGVDALPDALMRWCTNVFDGCGVVQAYTRAQVFVQVRLEAGRRLCEQLA
jgi:hypothetical protein